MPDYADGKITVRFQRGVTFVEGERIVKDFGLSIISNDGIAGVALSRHRALFFPTVIAMARRRLNLASLNKLRQRHSSDRSPLPPNNHRFFPLLMPW